MFNAIKIPLFIWLASCVIFVPSFLVSLDSRQEPIVALLAVLSGVFSFLVMWILAIIELSKSFRERLGSFLFLGLTSVSVTGVIIFFLSNMSTPDTQYTPQVEIVDCYIQGRLVRTTRQDCQQLSIQRQPNVVVQPAPRLQHKVSDSYLFDPPECTKCDEDYRGRIVCKTTKTWYCN